MYLNYCVIGKDNILGCSESSFRFLRNLIDMKGHTEKFFAKKPERFWKDIQVA